MIKTIFNRISRKAEFTEGAPFLASSFKYVPFKNDMANLTRMFQLRQYFIRNSPHERKSFQYTNELAFLHNQLNYLSTKIFLRRLVYMVLLGVGFLIFDTQYPRDWKDEFDLKFEKKKYGSLEEGANEGGGDDD